MSTTFEQAVLEGVSTGATFKPVAHYDPDGDCIEFLATNESYFAKRLDSLVTVYVGRDSGDIVGALMKSVSKLVQEILDAFPGFAADIEEDRVELAYLFTCRIWTSKLELEAAVIKTYKQLRDVAKDVVTEIPRLAA